MPQLEPTIWIVHPDRGTRTALARAAGSGRRRYQIVLGRPGDPLFAASAPAAVAVLGLEPEADLEPALDFVDHSLARAPDTRWIIVTPPGSFAEIERLFDTLDVQLLAHPADSHELRAALERALGGRATPLSARQGRGRLAARFSRWLARDETSGLERALDPRLADRPVLVRGERGTGRGLFLRYLHALSNADAGPCVRVACGRAARPDQLLAQLESSWPHTGVTAVWLDEIDRLPPDLQGVVADWIELGLPPGSIRGAVRWLASATDVDRSRPLEPRLALAFSELAFQLPPLREQRERIAPFALDTARAWSGARNESPRQFAEDALEALREDPWPGNFAELEAVVIRTLAHTSPDEPTIAHEHLRFDVDQPARGPMRGRQLERGEPSTAPTEPPDTGAAHEAPRDEGAAREPTSPVASASTPLEQLALAVAHEIRNPLVSIRTFSELLPEQHADAEFRTRFSHLVGDGVRRIEDVVARLQEAVEGASGPREPVDVSDLLESLLDEHREQIQARRLLVLKELDHSKPEVTAHAGALRYAFGRLVAGAIDTMPDRSDLYLASRHHEAPAAGRTAVRSHATVRVLLRYQTDARNAALPEPSLELTLASAAIRAQGGTLTIDNNDASETVVVVDLPAGD